MGSTLGISEVCEHFQNQTETYFVKGKDEASRNNQNLWRGSWTNKGKWTVGSDREVSCRTQIIARRT